jgi:hypothetical protein
VEKPDILDMLLLMGKLRRLSCPFCKAITARPMESQSAFDHRFFAQHYHRGCPKWTP